MTFDEALSILEVEADGSRQALRRAYMRRVKAHPPERDPEGFKLIREAYELVHATLASMPDMAENETPGRPGPDGVEPARFADDDPELAEPEDVEAALRQELRLDLVERRLDRAASLLWQRRPWEAKQELMLSFEAKALPARLTLALNTDAIIQLEASGLDEDAAELGAALREWLDATGAESEVMGGPEVGRWLLAAELLGTRGSVPGELRAIMAGLMAVGSEAILPVVRWASENRQAADTARLALANRFPTLCAYYHEALLTPSPYVGFETLPILDRLLPWFFERCPAWLRWSALLAALGLVGAAFVFFVAPGPSIRFVVGESRLWARAVVFAAEGDTQAAGQEALRAAADESCRDLTRALRKFDTARRVSPREEQRRLANYLERERQRICARP